MNYDNPLKAYIDLGFFRNNIGIVRSKFPGAKIILPVKANAYGHGDLIISREAEKLKIDCLAVARISEGIKLRENRIKLPVIDLGVELGSNINLAIDYNVELSVSSIEQATEISAMAMKKKKVVPVHLKLDTGMRRLGCNFEECLALAEYIAVSKYLRLKSVYTHFARSDDNRKTTADQIKLFLKFKELLSAKGIKPDYYHCHNSGAIIDSPDLHINESLAVRPGIMAYGYSPVNGLQCGLRPVMTLKSKVLNIKRVPKNTGVSYGHTFKTKKTSILATIALGYGDGFFRILSNKFEVTINGRNYKQRGTISMDLTVIEADENVKPGDEVIIFGDKSVCRHDANDLAKMAKTISYEITTSLTNRVERFPVNGLK